jgi:peptidyl-prolyl cis-trans isomerase B (cyclophilin B)
MFPRSASAHRPILGSATAAFGLFLTACASSTSGAGTPAGTPIHPQKTSPNVRTVSTSSSDRCSRTQAPAPRGAQRIPKPTLQLDPAKRYVVSLATNCGEIEIELDVREAPRTTASFAYLVKRGFYDDLTFHRVAAGFVIQGGDPNGDGSGGPGYTIVEPPPSNMRYTLGTVAMAKTETDPSGASGSQFFIVTSANAALPAQYALVGKVVGSFAGVERISKLPTNPPQDGAPTIPVVIRRATLSPS